MLIEGDKILVTGFVMLKGLKPGIYVTEEVTDVAGIKAYVFKKPKGKKEYCFYAHHVPVNNNNGDNCVQLIIEPETDVEYTSDENLHYDTSDLEGYVKVFSRERSEFHSNLKKTDIYQTSMLGITKIWYDAEMDDREYIILNNEIIYLDGLNKI
jgi:hypothetical protein